MSMQESNPEATVVKVLHAGSLTTLVRQELGPALYQGSGIALESDPLVPGPPPTWSEDQEKRPEPRPNGLLHATGV
jgi:hypothetical protein